ncbi:response regulator [Microbacterium sp. X-17]|uniref:response regulator n=1 Tax=Microbacterium sp. X-17 TaxID=3144404 RepID=UPI0031F5074E
MSPEVLTMIGLGATLLVSTLGGFAWVIARMDARFERVDARFERLEQNANVRFERLEGELVEIKVAIARVEGPRPRLVTGR